MASSTQQSLFSAGIWASISSAPVKQVPISCKQVGLQQEHTLCFRSPTLTKIDCRIVKERRFHTFTWFHQAPYTASCRTRSSSLGHTFLAITAPHLQRCQGQASQSDSRRDQHLRLSALRVYLWTCNWLVSHAASSSSSLLGLLSVLSWNLSYTSNLERTKDERSDDMRHWAHGSSHQPFLVERLVALSLLPLDLLRLRFSCFHNSQFCLLVSILFSLVWGSWLSCCHLYLPRDAATHICPSYHSFIYPSIQFNSFHFIHVFVCLFVCLFVCWFWSFSYLSIYLATYIPTYLSIHPPIHPAQIRGTSLPIHHTWADYHPLFSLL